MKKIEYKVFTPRESPEDLAQVIESYRNVFAAAPWNEWMKCQHCESYWGQKDGPKLAEEQFHHCGSPVVEYWPRHEVVSNIHHELGGNSSAIVAVIEGGVVGFCWGYVLDIVTLGKKLGVIFDQGVITRLSGINLAYQSEMAVLPGFRDQKIAKQMMRLRLEDFQSKRASHGIVRVRKSPEPSQTYLWYKEKLGYKVIAEYPEDDGRVIMARKFEGLSEILS